MRWSEKQIKQHKEAAKILCKLKDEAFHFISSNQEVTEYKVQEFILKKFEEYDLKSDIHDPIIGFNENSAIPHYFPSKKSKKLKPKTFILIDIWARLNKKGAPFSDITWVGYYGKNIPTEIQKTYDTALKARDKAIVLIKNSLKKNKIPTGNDIDNAAYKIIEKEYGKHLLHFSGHTLGTLSAHGKGNHLNPRNKKEILLNTGYALEPGIYIKNKFGIRSEINFYVDENMKLVLTTEIQKEIIKLK